MVEFKVRTRGNSDPFGKPRVYFTCHFDDFKRYFDKICEDIFAITEVDPAIYYTEDMSIPLDRDNLGVDLGQMNLFVVPVTYRLLCEGCRAMDVDISYAKEHDIPILPFMMESGIDHIYSRPENFGERQYIDPFCSDPTAIRYEQKLKKHLQSLLISDELADRVRAAFDAYVFLSYRKKDRRMANELMRIIHNIPGCRDIAIWFDEFLSPGESFVQNIEKAMKKSRLFTLLVTPSILEEDNFVMREEYPAAMRSEMRIISAEMEPTDGDSLREKYIGIPDTIDPRDEGFGEHFTKALSRIAVSENDEIPEHNYLIGLAYLDGIDVEVDSDRGVSLISTAANAGLPEAMKKLYNMNMSGDRVKLNYRRAQEWAERLVKHYTEELGEEHPDTIGAMESLAQAYCENGDYSTAIEVELKRYEISVRVFGESDDITTACMHSLALIYIELGEYERANQIEQEAFRLRFHLSISDMEKGISDIKKRGEIGVYMATLAKIYSKIYDTRMSTMLLRNQYEMIQDVLGVEHIETVKARNEYALSLMAEESYDMALNELTAIYDIRCRLLSEKHPHTLQTQSDLANLYCHIGDKEEAIRLYKMVYDLRCEVLGVEHPLVIETEESMKKMQPKKSPSFREVDVSSVVQEAKLLLEMHEDINKFINPLFEGYVEEELKWLNSMAEVYKNKNCLEAEKMFRDKIADLLNKNAAGSYESEKNRKLRLARQSFLDDDLEEAAKILGSTSAVVDLGESICKELTDSYGKEAKRTLDEKLKLVVFCFDMEYYVKALKLGIDLLGPYRDVYGYGNQNTQALLMAIACAARETGAHDVSILMWKKLYEIFVKQYGEFDENTLMVATSLAFEYKTTGDTVKACKYMEIVCKIMLHNAGSRDPKTRNYMDILEEWRSEL